MMMTECRKSSAASLSQSSSSHRCGRTKQKQLLQFRPEGGSSSIYQDRLSLSVSFEKLNFNDDDAAGRF
eukprot:COSAG02_NODE_59560_length_274_cov_0.577143_2_plen_68_part_01